VRSFGSAVLPLDILWFCFIAEETEMEQLISEKSKELARDLKRLTVRMVNFFLFLNAHCDFDRFPEIESWLVMKKKFLKNYGFRSDANFKKPPSYAKLSSLRQMVSRPVRGQKIS
jgi:hypothetical protein